MSSLTLYVFWKEISDYGDGYHNYTVRDVSSTLNTKKINFPLCFGCKYLSLVRLLGSEGCALIAVSCFLYPIQ